MMQVVQYSTSCVFVQSMYSVIQGTKLCSLEAFTIDEKPIRALSDPGDSTCQLMVHYVLVTPKGLHFSVQFLTPQGPILFGHTHAGLYMWDPLVNSITSLCAGQTQECL